MHTQLLIPVRQPDWSSVDHRITASATSCGHRHDATPKYTIQNYVFVDVYIIDHIKYLWLACVGKLDTWSTKLFRAIDTIYFITIGGNSSKFDF